MNHQSSTVEAIKATDEVRKLVGGRKKLPKLTRKQAAFVKELIERPKEPAYKAAEKAYKVTTQNSARQLASENLTKPNIMAYLNSHAAEAESAVVQVMQKSLGMADSPAHASVALAAAKDVLDRVHGKATQRIEQTSTSVVIGIDLSRASLPDEVVEGEVA